MFAGLFASIGAKLAASFLGQKVKQGAGLLSEIPQPVWEALTVVGYVLAFVALHWHYEKAALKAADERGYERRASEDADALVELQKRARGAEALATQISQATRTKNDADNASIHAAAGSLLAHGPGAARCGLVGHSVVPAASGEPRAVDHQPTDATGALLPGDDGQANLAAVPWNWLVGRSEQCDLDRAEALAWRDWYMRQAAAWERLKTGGKK